VSVEVGTLPSRFGLTLANIPLDNLRTEFLTYRGLLSKPEFRAQCGPFGGAPIETPYMIWYGLPDTFLTLILQRAIVGIEAFVAGAVFFELGARGRLSRSVLDCIQNPFRLGGKSTADIVYNRLPALFTEEVSLKRTEPALWESTREFYSAIRNPLFHGYQLAHSSPEAVAGAYEQIAKLHMWVNSWHDFNELPQRGDAAQLHPVAPPAPGPRSRPARRLGARDPVLQASQGEMQHVGLRTTGGLRRRGARQGSTGSGTERSRHPSAPVAVRIRTQQVPDHRHTGRDTG
jgi:hypothetical protein